MTTFTFGEKKCVLTMGAISNHGAICTFPVPHEDALVSAEDIDGAINGAFSSSQQYITLDCHGAGNGDSVCTNTEVKIDLKELTSDEDSFLPDDDTLLKD